MSIVFTISETFRPGETSTADRAHDLLDRLDLAIPHTTRPRRSADDNEFVFTSQDVFERLIASQEFLEYVNILGPYYGTPSHYLQEAQANGNDLLIKVDENGVAQIKQKLPDAVSILVLHTLSGQHERATGSTVDERLLHRLYEESQQSQIPSPDKFDHVVANDRLEESVNQVVAIIRSVRSQRS